MSNQEKRLFEHLVTKHLDYIYSKAIRLMHNAEKGEILVQQTLEDASMRFPQFDKKDDFKTWLDDILMTRPTLR
ncbi:MAG: hypothetical protein EHM72_20160 [Calditrichaeota bacterium]|nr:MAG: hypothetical protein EHM72_20160 [Calditrichota bacterium]